MCKTRMFVWLLVVVFCLCTASGALGEDRILFSSWEWMDQEETRDFAPGIVPFYPTDIAYEGSTLFIFGSYHDVDSLYRYTLGDALPTLIRTFESACGCQFADVSELTEEDIEEWSNDIWSFTRGDRMMAFNGFTQKLGTLTDTGVEWGEVPLAFPESMPKVLDYSDDRHIQEVIIQNETVVVVVQDPELKTQEICLFDLKTGVYKGNPHTVAYFDLLAPYKDNSVIGVREITDTNQVDLVAFNYLTGQETTLPSLSLPEDQVLTGLCWSTEENALLYAIDLEVYRLKEGEAPEVVAYLPILFDGYGRDPAIVLSGAQYILVSYDGVILRDLRTPPIGEKAIREPDAAQEVK